MYNVAVIKILMWSLIVVLALPHIRDRFILKNYFMLTTMTAYTIGCIQSFDLLRIKLHITD